MGGNALSTPSVRLTADNFKRMAQACVSRLQSVYPQGRVQALVGYRSKADHGDLDILIAAERYDPLKAAHALDATEVVRNGPVTSLGVVVRPGLPAEIGNVFQVDLIKIDADSFDFACQYFGHGDAGNLLGRIAHAMGLALRHDGLYFYYRDGDYLFREIVLTKDFSRALAYLGYRPCDLLAGFDAPVDIYEFVASSPFFNKDIFLLENRNAKSRVRDKKRKMYMEFLQWCEAKKGTAAFSFPDDKSAWLPRIAEHFPSFPSDLERAHSDLARARQLKERFNGALVSHVTGLEGKPLGAVMKHFKESFVSLQAQEEFILKSSTPEIEQRIKQVAKDVFPDLFPTQIEFWKVQKTGWTDGRSWFDDGPQAAPTRYASQELATQAARDKRSNLGGQNVLWRVVHVRIDTDESKRITTEEWTQLDP